MKKESEGSNDVTADSGETGIPKALPSKKQGFLDPVEHGPSTKLYRKPQKRPRLSDIRNDDTDSTKIESDYDIVTIPETHYSKEKFNWFIGVFVPMFLNLICVTFFIDLHRSIQAVGWGLAFLLFSFSLSMSYSSLVSVCVIATNGEMRDGGCYYLISRTLGPQIGGAIGITLVLAHTTAIAFRLSYASLVISHLIYPNVITSTLRMDRSLIQLGLNIIVFFITLLGIRPVMYVLFGLLCLLVLGVINFFLGLVLNKPGSTDSFTGFSTQTLRSNFFGKGFGLLTIFHTLGLLFPSSNAIMTCANFSGNLFPPRRAIPLGSFVAMIVSSLLLIGAFFLESGSFSFDKFGSNIELTKYLSFDSSFYPPISYIGFIAACVGSSLTMHTGSSRIMNAMAEDGLLPRFLLNNTINGESLWAHLLQLVLSFVLVVLDSPDTSTIVTNVVFLLPFSLVNWAVWTADSAHYPGFRPSFRFFSRWVSLLFSFLCIMRMFMISWEMSLICFAVFFIVYQVYSSMELSDHWGTVTQSHVYYSTLQEELNLYHVKPHPKTYRPNILLVTTQHPDKIRIYINFLNKLLNGHGMSAVGRIFITESGEFDYHSLINEREGTFLANSDGNQTFYDVTSASTFVEGVSDLIVMMGIGRMRPNILCLTYPENWSIHGEDDVCFSDFLESIPLAIDATMAVLIMRNAKLISEISVMGNIDVWWDLHDGGHTLLIGYLLSKMSGISTTKLRVLSIVDLDSGETIEQKQKEIADSLYKFRIKAEILTIDLSKTNDNYTPMTYTSWRVLSRTLRIEDSLYDSQILKEIFLFVDLIRAYSSLSSTVLFTLPKTGTYPDQLLYMVFLEMISNFSIPFFFVRGGGDKALGEGL